MAPVPSRRTGSGTSPDSMVASLDRRSLRLADSADGGDALLDVGDGDGGVPGALLDLVGALFSTASSWPLAWCDEVPKVRGIDLDAGPISAAPSARSLATSAVRRRLRSREARSSSRSGCLAGYRRGDVHAVAVDGPGS